MLKLVKGTRKYNERTYGIKDIDLVLPETGLVLISGESGAGKTTLINILTASDNLTSGELYYDGTLISKKEAEEYRSRHTAIVYQDFELINDLSVYDNVALGANIAGEVSYDRIIKVLDSLNISHLKDSLIMECSGGEIQRVAIARALAKDTKMIFADEPTGNLDSENSENIFKILKEISKDKLVVLVSHNTERALKYCDYYIILKDGRVYKSTCPTYKDKISDPILLSKKKTRIPSNLMRKLSMWTINRNNLKPIVNISIIALIMSILYLMLPLGFYDYPLVLSRNLKRAELPLIKILSYDMDPFDPLSNIPDKWGLVTFPLISGIENDFTAKYYEEGLSHYNGVYVSLNVQTTEYNDSLGLDFVFGKAPKDDFEVGISYTQAINIVSMQYIYDENKEIVRVESLDELIGKYFIVSDGGLYDIKLMITGIFEDHFIYRNLQETATLEDYNSNDIQTAKENFLVGLSVTNYYTMCLLNARRTRYYEIDGFDPYLLLKPLTDTLALSDNGIQISRFLANNCSISLGDTISISSVNDEESRSFVIERIVEEGYNYIYINPDTYISEFNDFIVSHHIVYLGYNNQLKKLRLINNEIEKSYPKSPLGFFLDFHPRMTSMNSYNLPDIALYLVELSIVLFIPVSIGLIIILFLNTNALTNYSISQSMKNFSILRSIGYSKQNIRNIITLKSLFVAIFQILIGLFIGSIMIMLFNAIMSTTAITHIIIISLDIRKFLIINLSAFISYTLIIISKSNSLFRDSAAIDYRKR